MNRLILLAGLACCLALTPSARAQDKKPEDKGKPETKPIVIQIDGSKLPPDVLKRLLELAQPTKEPVKGEEKKPEKGAPGQDEVHKRLEQALEELAAAKKKLEMLGQKGLPPGVEKKIELKVQPKTPVKTISLADAIAIAEKTAQGTAFVAERHGDEGAVSFEVVVVGKDGRKQAVKIDGAGQVQSGTPKKGDIEQKPEGKGKNQGESEGEDKKPTRKEKDD